VPGSVVRKFAQHLVADGCDAVFSVGRRDQLANLPLLIIGQARAPAD
jgi:hypothetical protein